MENGREFFNTGCEGNQQNGVIMLHKLTLFVMIGMKRGFWGNKLNQKKFLDEAQVLLNIKEPADWGKVTYQKLSNVGGASLLNYYGGSVKRAVLNIYPGISIE